MDGIVRHICDSLLILICCSVLCRGNQHCLTWDIQQERLRFICRVPGLSDPVSLIDSQGQLYAKCTFNRKAQHCTPYVRNNLIVTHYTLKYVIFTIGKLNNNTNGLWICTQNSLRLTTNVSLSKGIIDSTEVRISGQFHDMKDNPKTILWCFSCREPDGNNVEFHENVRSMDSITFSRDTGSCTHYTGKCHPGDCSCNGLEFMRAFRYDKKRNVTTYSCEMMFTDTFTNQKFAVLSSVFFNGKEFYNMSSSTEIIKPGVIIWDGTLLSPDENEISTELDPTRITPVTDSSDDIEVRNKGDLNSLHVIAIVIVCLIGSVFSLLFVRRHYKLKTSIARYKNDVRRNEFDTDVIPLLDNKIASSTMTEESYLSKDNKITSSTMTEESYLSKDKNDVRRNEFDTDVIPLLDNKITSSTMTEESYLSTDNKITSSTMTEESYLSKDKNDVRRNEFDTDVIPLLDNKITSSTMTEESYVSKDNGIKSSKMTVESHQIKEKHHFKLFVYTEVTKLYSCDPCTFESKDRAAVVFCFDCEVALCAICSHTHNVMEVTKSHNCLNIHKIPKTISLPLPCVDHNSMKYQYYCLNHDCPCCITCIITFHSGKGCQVKPIHDVLKRFHGTQQLSICIHKIYEYYVSVLNSLITYQYHMIDRIATITSIITTASGSEKIKTNRKRIKSDTKLNADFDNIKVQLNAYAKETSDIHFSAEDQKALLEFMKTYGSERQLFILTHCLKQNMMKIYERVQELIANTEHVRKYYEYLQTEQCSWVITNDVQGSKLYNKLRHLINA